MLELTKTKTFITCGIHIYDMKSQTTGTMITEHGKRASSAARSEPRDFVNFVAFNGLKSCKVIQVFSSSAVKSSLKSSIEDIYRFGFYLPSNQGIKIRGLKNNILIFHTILQATRGSVHLQAEDRERPLVPL